MTRDISGTKFLLIAALGMSPCLPHSPAVAAVSPKEPLRLKPSSKWLVDYKEEGCTLARQFGEGKENSILLFHRYGPEDGFRLTIGGDVFRKAANQSMTDFRFEGAPRLPRGKAEDGYSLANLQFGPSEQMQELGYFGGTVSDAKLPAMVFRSGVSLDGLSAEQKAAVLKKQSIADIVRPPMTDDRIAAVTYLEVSKPLKQSVILETGAMAKPMAALSKCVDDLVSSWGVDVEKHKSATRYVVPESDPGKWILSNDYPPGMLREGQPAIVEFRLNVSEQGSPTACHIQATTRAKEFDDAVCKALMKRAKFTPALDSAGQPMASYFKSRVLFQIT